MSIETACPGCGRKLRVEDEFVGQQARCPICGEIYLVPGVEPTPQDATDAAAVPPDQAGWRMRTPEGQLYGPVNDAELQRWVEEGRITADCELLDVQTNVWRSAESVYPVLSEPAPVTVSDSQPSRYRYTSPHRGVLILVTGIVGWFACCPLFGVAAWVMGTSDLQEMRSSRMDPSGRGMTQAGTVLGMFQVGIAVVGILVMLFVFLSRAALR